MPHSSKRTLFLSICCFLIAAVAVAVIYNTEPKAKREGATKRGPMLVETLVVSTGEHQPIISAMGTVHAEHDIRLQARVEGQVVEKNTAFFPGGILAENTPLVRIDALDYELALENARANLLQAEAALTIAKGERDAAAVALKQVSRTVSDEQRALILKEPEMQQAQAQVRAARAAVRQAETNLARTHVKTPFRALALTQNTDRGAQVRPGDTIARLVGVERYWVEAQIPASSLPWLRFPSENGAQGSLVEIRDNSAWTSDVWREGRLLSLIGAMDEGTRLAKILVSVDDPLGLKNPSLPRLSIGAFVEARIHGARSKAL